MTAQPMTLLLQRASDTWWLWLVRGILAIVVAGFAFMRPADTLAAFALLLGAYFVADGIVTLFHGIGQQPDGRSRWPLIIWGALAIVAGLTILTHPLYQSVLALTMVVGFWAIVLGVTAIAAGIALGEELGTQWWLIAAGVLSIIFGTLVWTNLAAGALSVAYLIGMWSLLLGISLVLFSFQVKHLGDRLARPA